MAGINYRNATADGVVSVFRLDLPNAGTYAFHLANGDTNGGTHVQQYIEIFDDTTSLLVRDDSGNILQDHYNDATGVDLTEAAWPGSEASVDLTFTTTVFKLQLGKLAYGQFHVLAHIRLVEQVGGGGGKLWVPRRRIIPHLIGR